jgi:hypothetical protein
LSPETFTEINCWINRFPACMHNDFKLLAFAIFFSFTASLAFAQQKYTISGYVKEAKSGESLLGANVYLKETLQGTQTNQYGFYSLTVPSGKYTVVYSYIGFEEQRFEIDLSKSIQKNVDLGEAAIETKEVTVKGEREDKNVNSVQMGQEKIEVEQIKKLPAFMGEVDILKSIQLLPGVQSGGEGNTGFYVRGGSLDQNLILLDEATVYNASHMFGFFSVFNADAIQNATLTKGGMPAQYGGRLSSVLDIQMKEGNNKSYHVDAGIGPIASRLTVQGPIKKDVSSFIASGRRSFMDLFMGKPFVKKDAPAYGNKYYFYDLNLKVNYRLSDKDRLFLSGYFGRDVFQFNSPTTDFSVKIPWGNATATARWNHLFNQKLFVNTSFIFTNYDFSFEGGQDKFSFKLFSGITDYNAKSDFTWLPDVKHNVKFGVNYVYHIFVPSHASAESDDVVFDLGKIVHQYAHDGAVYINDEYDLSEKIKVSGGLRGTFFQQVGPFDRYLKDPLTDRTNDTVTYSAGKPVKTYWHAEPRISLRWSLNHKSSIKASYTQNYQYLHLASLSSLSLPTDLWIPSSDRVTPQFATQYALGYFRNFKNNIFETSVEVYYKTMDHQIEYKPGYTPDGGINDNADNGFVFGKGWSYGAEFFLKKAKGKFSGWIGYTLAWTKRQFPDLNNGEEYFAKHDRRHDVSVVLMYEASERLAFGATWVYATGDLSTLPKSVYFINGQITYDYGSNIYNYRIPSYHRLDVSVTWKNKPQKKFRTSWNFSVFNLYNRYNPYIIYLADESNYSAGTFKIQAKQISLFPVIPSITFNISF